MKLSRRSIVLIFSVFVLFTAIPASAGLITNGDFEANGINSYINDFSGTPPFDLPGLPVPTGWTSTGPTDSAAVIAGVAFDPGNPRYDLPSHEAAFYGLGGLSQSFATVADTDYVLSFESNGLAFGGFPHNSLMTVTLFDGSTSLASTSYAEQSTFRDPSVTRTLAFHSTSATTRIEFHYTFNDPIYDGRYFALIDNVSVAPAASATPEPASWALLFCGSLLIANRAIRRIAAR